MMLRQPRRLLLCLVTLWISVALVFISAAPTAPIAAAETGSASIVESLQPEHPRLLATAADFADLRTGITSDEQLARWYAEIRAEADMILSQPVSEYEFPDGRSLLQVTRRVLARSYTLGLAYQVDGDERHAERLWAELDAAAQFPDWNPESFLSTAEMTHAFAIGYDWLFDYWSGERRQILREAIVELGLTPAKAAYDQGDWWVSTTNNWNIVCNAGIGLGVLAVGDEVPELADELLAKGRESLPTALAEYAPAGAYPEGVTYWDYATRYLVPYLAALDTALGDDLGLSDSPGLAQTGEFPIYLHGTAGQPFNYYDAGGSATYPPEMFWLAAKYDEPVYASWTMKGSERKPHPRNLLWYDPDFSETPAEADWPLDKYFPDSEVVSARGSWTDPAATFAGFKAGDNRTNHGDLDLGTFVMDALGTRWAVELGSEDYGVPGYWDAGSDGQRWTYYRKRAEGQNTLVVNPGQSAAQDPLAAGEIVSAESGATESYSIADLSEAYAAHDVTSWQRGVALLDHRRQVLVQDELRAQQPVDTWWFMHTRASVEVADDGRSAILSDGDRRLRAEILAPTDGAEFVVMDAAPLWSSPDPPEQSENAGERKLAIELSDVTDLRLSVLLTPLRDGDEPDRPDVEPLADWSIPHASASLLSEVSVDGVPLAGFEPGNFTYDVVVDPGTEEPPRVAARSADPNAKVNVEQASALPGMAEIVVTKARTPATRYRVHLGAEPTRTVTASINGTYPPEHTIDGNLATFFSAQGVGQWVQYDMGAPAEVDGMALAWYQGDTRSSSFDIQISSDGETWTEVYTGESSGAGVGLEEHRFEPVTARYVRVVGLGNTDNDWLSITEARVLRADGVWPVIETPPPFVESITASVSDPELASGESARVTVEGTLSDGSPADLSDALLRFVSSNDDVARVDGDGTVHAGEEGDARIAAVVTTVDGRLLHAGAAVTVVDPGRRIVQPSGDTFVRGGTYGDDNYGGSTSMTVKQDGNPDYYREAYLAFDLSAIEGEIESATLNFSGRVQESGGVVIGDDLHSVDIHALADDWDEASVTWNTRPTVGDRAASIRLDENLTWRSIDLTELVRDDLAGGGRLSVALRHVAPAGNRLPVGIQSRESPNSPYLDVKLGAP